LTPVGKPFMANPAFYVQELNKKRLSVGTSPQSLLSCLELVLSEERDYILKENKREINC
jgi:hypothetical protein